MSPDSDQHGDAADGDVTPEAAARNLSEPVQRRTGEPRVDAAVERLDQLTERPVAEHVELFDDVHGTLRGVLDDLDGS